VKDEIESKDEFYQEEVNIKKEQKTFANLNQ